MIVFMPALWELADLATPWSLHVAATLRIADHIAGGIDRIAPLAEAAHADRDSLLRVLRQLVEKGIFEEPEPGRFALNDTARQLLDPVMRGGFDLDLIGGRMAHSWSTLLTAVRTGRPAYHEVFGRPFWDDLDANPSVAESFDQLMGPGHGDPDPDILPDPGAWPSIRTIVDVGGGTGSLLAAVLRAHPDTRGTLVDVPRAIARSGEVFERAGVADRATAVGQSFFDALPAGADLYFMKSVLSDWPDREAGAILTRCAEAMTPTSRLVLVNGVNPDDTAKPDLLMLVLVGGRERTLADFEPIARQAGLAVSTSGRNAAGRFLVECRRA
jgi:2,7-dihydroxy-5-methyl-1-naphthoate 7-O-methyltransferase